MNDDLDVLFLVLDEFLEAALNNILGRDASGDELLNVAELALLQELDDLGVVVRVSAAADEVDLAHGETEEVHVGVAAPDRHVHDGATVAGGVEHGLQ